MQITKRYPHKLNIYESFEFDNLSLDSVDLIGTNDLVSKSLAYKNLDIPYEQFLASVCSMKPPFKDMRGSKILNTYPAWVSPKKPILPGRILSALRRDSYYGDKNSYYEECTGQITNDSRTMSYLTQKYREELLSKNFKLISSQKTKSQRNKIKEIDVATVSADVVSCINALLKHVTGQDYDFRDTLYGNKTYEPDDTSNRIHYQLFLSPDSGFIITNYITEYSKSSIQAERKSTWSQYTEITEPPIHLCMPMIVFTNTVGYVLNYNKSDGKTAVSELAYNQRMKEFIQIMEEYNQFGCMRNMMMAWHPVKDAWTYKIDPHGHIWYPCAPRNYWICKDYQSPEPKTKTNLIEDMTKVPKKYTVYSFCPVIRASDDWELVIKHPKIRGFKNKEREGCIIYQTNDPEFCDRLLGPGASVEIRKYGVLYVYNKKTGLYDYMYTFVWYDDTGMKMFDDFFDTNMAMTAYKRKLMVELKKRLKP